MSEFDFGLRFTFPDSDIPPEQYVNRLGEEGCDDAIIGVGQKGRIAFQFTRTGDSALTAVMSAIKDVKRVIPEAMLIEATPDLVGLSDIANVIGSSRQNIHKLMLSHNNTFPAPVHAGKYSIWHLSNILEWFEKEQNKTIDPITKEIAEINKQVNIAKEKAQSNAYQQSELLAVGF